MKQKQGICRFGPILLIFVIVFIIIAPFLFTRPAICEALSFVNTGQIGDTIGGITAPFVGIISILLLFCTLKAQLIFNKEQKTDNAISQILSLQSEIIHMDERVTFSYTPKKSDGGSTEKIVTVSGISSLTLLQVQNEYYPKILLHHALYLSRELDPFIALLKCYKSLLVENDVNEDSDYFAFFNSYKKSLKDFLMAIESGCVIEGNCPADNKSDEDYPSEVENVIKDFRTIIDKLDE